MSATIDADAHVVEANKIFSRVLVGVDGRRSRATHSGRRRC